MKTPFLSPLMKVSLAMLAVSLFAIYSARAVMVTWVGTNGISATTNWSDMNNWHQINTNIDQTPVADAANFTFWTAVQSPGLITVNVDGAYGTPGTGFAQSYGAFFSQTNGYHTVLIQPGVSWNIAASSPVPFYTNSGAQGLGILVSPSITNNNNLANINTVSTGTYTNYTTITGNQGIFWVDGGASGTASVPGGLRVEGASTTVDNHYSILDMSGLGAFFMTNVTGLSSHEGFQVVNGGANSQALCYLAMTNTIWLNDFFQVGYLGASSNSLPIGVYLGQTNFISTGANNNFFVIGYVGCTNAFMQFNPTFIGGATLPTAYITGTGGNQMAQICNAATGVVPGYAICDFTGGSVTWIGNSLTLGKSGATNASPFTNTAANGVLTFPNGTVTFNTIVVGNQSVSNGCPGVGTINIGTNATLQANTSLTLGATTGTANTNTAGTINVSSNGTLAASTVTGGGAGSTINTFDSYLDIALASETVTNIVVANFNATGASNVINITSIPIFLAGGLPARFHLISTPVAANLVGASTFVLGPMPTSPNPSYPYAGHLDTSTNGLVDFVLTAGPPSVRALTWSGTNTGGADGVWDISTNQDWLLTNGTATGFNQLDLTTFNDITSPGDTSVSLTTTLTPTSVTVSNNSSLYTFGSSGSLSGSTGLTKAGTGTLIIDNSTSNSFTGQVLISGGILQVGNGDMNGNLPAGVSVSNNSVLAYGRTDDVVLGDTISGSGAVVSGGGGTLKLAAPNTFTGPALATNNSILQMGAVNALGATNGTLVIANGSTFDANGYPALRSIIVSGTGVGGNGAIINSGGAIYDSSTALSPSITLAGDTTFSYTTRWDYGLLNGPSETLSTGGQPYNLTLNGTANNSYFEWRFITADPALANISVTAGYFGIVGNTTLGSTSYSLNILAGGSIKLYNADGFYPNISKPIVLNDEGTIYNETGTNTISGSLNITNSGGNQYCVVDIAAGTLTVTGPVSGNGILWMETGAAPLIINGNASAFTGGALVYTGSTLTINNVFGSGITNNSGSFLTGTGTANGNVDMSGTFVPGATNTPGTFTAAGGLTLENSSSTVFSLEATTNVGGGQNSLVAVTGNLTLNGSPSLLINPIGTLVNGTYTLMTYTGTLAGSFGSVQTVASPDGYVPGSGYNYTLNTSTPHVVQLVVGDAPNPGTFVAPYTISGSTLTWAGTGGTPSGTYRLYTTTNISTPLTNWTLVGSNSFDGSGNFSFPITMSNGPAHFFILKEP